MDFDHREKKLEEAIEYYLTTKGGFNKGGSNSFDRKLGKLGLLRL